MMPSLMTAHKPAARATVGRRAFAELAFLTLLAGCRGQAPAAAPTGTPGPIAQPTPTPSPEPTETYEGEFRIIGYVMDWAGTDDEIQYDKLTHINYAFLVPREDGSVGPIRSPRKLARIIAAAHEQGVKVVISLGGWGYDGQFETLAADPEASERFVGEVIRCVDKYGFDGTDMDWEYPDVGESALRYAALIRRLGDEMHSVDKLITAAVVALGESADSILPEVFDTVDFLNVMVYDGPGENHASYQYALDALDYWRGRGLPRAKTVLGVPFYGRPSESPYKKLVAANPEAAQNDCIEVSGKRICYNGIPTMQRKTRLAMQRASGIMIWALTHDTSDDTSLLAAIYRTAHAE